MSGRITKLIELQMHLEYARRLLDELTREAIEERERIEEEEERENKREIRPHRFMIPKCEVVPEVRTPPAAATAAVTAPQLPVPQELPTIHPRLWYRRQGPQQVFTIPQTEDWDSEATQAPFALPITHVNWENDWSQRCVCGARPGRCQH
jgi:hypothetical protein